VGQRVGIASRDMKTKNLALRRGRAKNREAEISGSKNFEVAKALSIDLKIKGGLGGRPKEDYVKEKTVKFPQVEGNVKHEGSQDP